ncbi:hypothetical protein FB567DRAFT_513065 [Paraphoma chrysanthemicola]|uniref:Uncharacterized protein n=1 Tax=Paraphoma chrysanthemicola TaxID=798071 RepID=A0A8K0RJJ4_9PLEO|nr:hypothetical protein FB567DRAFT_513065 [Paraphoma chrysanthemicola]
MSGTTQSFLLYALPLIWLHRASTQIASIVRELIQQLKPRTCHSVLHRMHEAPSQVGCKLETCRESRMCGGRGIRSKAKPRQDLLSTFENRCLRHLRAETTEQTNVFTCVLSLNKRHQNIVDTKLMLQVACACSAYRHLC